MAANQDPVFAITPHPAGAQLTSADTTTIKDVITGATNGTRVDNITCATNDTVAVDLGFYIQVGGAGTNHYLGNVHLAAGAGYTNVPGVEAISTLPLNNFRAIVLGNGDKLRVGCAATMTGSKTTDVMALGGDF